jgi:hypothetical protein
MSPLAATVSPVATFQASPFPVDPADVPEAAVRYVKRTILRHADRFPLDDDVARLIVAGVIAVLAEDRERLDEVAVLVSQYTLATGDVVAIQAARGEIMEAAWRDPVR